MPDLSQTPTPPADVLGQTRDYDTNTVLGAALTGNDTLVGESGGLSSIYEVGPSSAMPGLLCVQTEHGALFLDPECEYAILAE